MIEWLGIEHLFELSGAEAIAGFFTPLAVFAVFALAQLILPARRVPGYVINPETGEPRNYRLNGISGVCDSCARVGFRAHRDAPRLVLPVVGLRCGRGNGLHRYLRARCRIQPATGRAEESPGGVLDREGPGDIILQRTLRREDVVLRRRRDDVGAQRPVRCRLPLRALRRRLQSRRFHVRGVLRVLHTGLLHL